MKNLVLSITVLILASQTIAQQKAQNSLGFDPYPEKHFCQQSDICPDFENEVYTLDDFAPIYSAIQKEESTIQVDSIFLRQESGYNLKKLTYDESGNLESELWQVEENKIWVNVRMWAYAYDENGNLLTELSQTWIENEWRKSGLISNTYDNNGNRISWLSQYWDGSTFTNQSLTTSTFDINDNILTSLYQDWENGEWVNSSFHSLSYNFLDKIETLSIKEWENDEWQDHIMCFGTYNTNGEMQSWLMQSYIFGEWYQGPLASYSYNAEGQVISQLKQDWDAIENIWVDFMTDSYTYDISGNWNSCNRQYLGEPLFDSYLKTRTFDNAGNLTMELKQLWNEDSLVNNTKNEYTFSPGKVRAKAYDWIDEQWIESLEDEFLDIYINGIRVYSDVSIALEFYYTDVTGIEEEVSFTENEIIHCFPNPVANQINIEINPTWQADDFQIELFNQCGQRVKSFELSSSSKSAAASINVEDVPPGLYLLKVTAGQFTSSQKVIVSR